MAGMISATSSMKTVRDSSTVMPETGDAVRGNRGNQLSLDFLFSAVQNFPSKECERRNAKLLLSFGVVFFFFWLARWVFAANNLPARLSVDGVPETNWPLINNDYKL